MPDPLVTFRTASMNDCSDPAILSDAATRRLSSFLWAASATVGQSPFEIGRGFIRTQADHFTHFARWQIAEVGGRTAGALNCCLLPAIAGDGPLADIPDVVRTLNELKAIAGGTWYITAAAVFPEYRNLGIGKALPSRAEAMAHEQGVEHLTLMVGSFNEGAQRLYRRFGFSEWDRRAFVPFPGSDHAGSWILMRKQVRRGE